MYSLETIKNIIATTFTVANIDKHVIRFRPLSQWNGITDDINWHHWRESEAIYFLKGNQVANNALKVINCDSIMNGGNSSSNDNAKWANEESPFDMVIVKTKSYNHNDGHQTEFMVYKKDVVYSTSSDCYNCDIESALQDAKDSFYFKDKWYIAHLESLEVKA